MAGIRALAIVNPAAAAGRGATVWRRVEPILRGKLPDLEVRLTAAPGDAERWAREWGGARGHPGGVVVVVGGDGSVHEAVNGLLGSDLRFRLAIIPAGTGNDIARNLELPPNPLDAAADLVPVRARTMDVGRCSFRTGAGEARSRFFLNSVSTGTSARANRLAVRLGQVLPGAARYPLSGLAALVTGTPVTYKVTSGGRVLHHGPALNLTVANGACFGGGLRISPGSDPADGVLDLVVIGAMGRFRGLRALSRLRAGTHVEMKQVHTMPLRDPIQIRRGAGVMMIEVDGENLEAEGELRIEILPGRLTIVSGER